MADIRPFMIADQFLSETGAEGAQTCAPSPVITGIGHDSLRFDPGFDTIPASLKGHFDPPATHTAALGRANVQQRFALNVFHLLELWLAKIRTRSPARQPHDTRVVELQRPARGGKL